ncbi:dTMP kinase [Balneolales bacterium ANBcel1]|nr:dTMP kinase [Balneolales bacterium ANBcel1]
MLISLEGIDGCGKTTQIQKIEAFYKSRGREVRVFREPGGTGLSEQIREILLNSKEDIHPLAETLLFSAARAQLVARQVRPLLQEGTIVILDRFYDSTTAYQGFGREALPVEDIENINRIATAGLQPDITFYLKIDEDIALKRRLKSGEEDRMERSGNAFFSRVAKGFDHIASKNKRVATIDASRNPDEIFSDIRSHLLKADTRFGP